MLGNPKTRLDRRAYGFPCQLAALSLLAWCLTACESPPADPEPHTTAPPAAESRPASAAARFDAAEARTRKEFEAICRRFRDGDERQYGRRPLAVLTARLEAVRGDLPAEAEVHGRLGFEHLRLGQMEESLRELNRAAELLRQAGGGGALAAQLDFILGLAYLQAAEDQNCIDNHTAASCILPIRGDGIHPIKEPGRQAGDHFLAVVEAQPRNLSARWLLNLARMITDDHPQGVPEPFRLPPTAFAAEEEFPPWRDVAPELGVNVVDLAGGAVMDDFDGDGLLDLVTSTYDHCDGMKAFRNTGDGGFEEVTEAWGLEHQFGGLNLVHADYDNDGDLDLLVLRGAWLLQRGKLRNSLLRNDLAGPAGRFVDATREAGMATPAYPTQTAVWGDYDGDGDLDLFVGNESAAGENHPSQLFRNDGDGTFTDVAAAAGVENLRYAKAVAWGDYDDDGDADLYVSNHGVNRLYRNDGDGGGGVTFTDVAPALGVTGPDRSFASWFFDFDNDGDLDLFVADYEGPPDLVVASYFELETGSGQPYLYRNDGGRFAEVSRPLGIVRPALPMGANYGDLDNDGWLDVYLGTGDPFYENTHPNVMLRNRRGEGFGEVTFAGGFGHIQKGHGVAFGDLDNDGDQDLFHQLGGFFPGDDFGNVLFENPEAEANWITLRLVGRRANRFGVGARIEVKVAAAGGERSIHLLAGSGGSFGGSSLQQEIGLGDAEAIVEIVLRWPGSGTVQVFPGVPMNRVYDAVEGEGELVAREVPRLRLGAGTAAHGAHHPP